MKKQLLAISTALVVALGAQAQIPNSGFEDWDMMPDYNNPIGWATVNGAIPGGLFFTCTRSTDHYPANVGSYSMRLETNLQYLQGGWGIAVTDTIAYPFEPAFAIQGNPTSLHGYYKFVAEAGDQAWVRLVFFFEGEIVAEDDFLSEAASTNGWEAFQITMPQYAEADSATLMIFNFYPTSQTDGPNGNSVLSVDNLSFNVPITGVSEQEVSSMMSFYPNPTRGQVTLNVDAAIAVTGSLNVYNALGQMVYTTAARQQQTELDLTGLENGIYTLEWRNVDTAVQQKLVVQH